MNMLFKKRRKRFNRVVKTLSELYNREYKEVLSIYNKMNGKLEDTKVVLNMLNVC